MIKVTALLLAAVGLVGCSVVAPMQTSGNLIQACKTTAEKYAFIRDRLLYKEYGELFTEDAIFEFGENQFRGRAAIVKALRTRGNSATTRHFTTVAKMEVTSDKTVAGVSYLNLYQKQNDSAVTNVIVAEYHDQFLVRQDRCQIQKRRVELVMMVK